MKKGFATSAILYTILLLFLVLMTGILHNLQNKKTILDALKKDTVSALEQDTVIDAILDQMGMINTNFVDLEKRVALMENQIKESVNLNGNYRAIIVFGKLQAGYSLSNSIFIGDMRNKKITVTAAIVEGLFYLNESELTIFNQCIVKDKDGFSFMVAHSTDVDIRALASKIAGYGMNVQFTIEDIETF